MKSLYSTLTHATCFLSALQSSNKLACRWILALIVWNETFRFNHETYFFSVSRCYYYLFSYVWRLRKKAHSRRLGIHSNVPFLLSHVYCDITPSSLSRYDVIMCGSRQPCQWVCWSYPTRPVKLRVRPDGAVTLRVRPDGVGLCIGHIRIAEAATEFP